ncbi:MAG: PKD domain-containing protein [Bacteroidota bacterium]|nr:PKD domain-containing protein [Bacteroidota bacterium]
MTGTSFAFSQNPVANFTANVTSGCSPLTVSFTDQSTGNPTVWSWEFSNGTLSSVQNPVVTFSSPGTYSVKLVVQNANGIAQLEKIDYITVFPSPVADFSANITLSCIPAVINFTDLSSTPVGTITNWDWDFGDGATSTLQNPSHTYNNVGFYTVTLTITGSTGCKSISSKGSYIRVVGGVTTGFSYSLSSTCRPPFTVSFQNQSSGPGNISYTWDFGNGQTSTAQNPSVVYNSPGTYTVLLNSQSDLGCSGSQQQTITITSTTTDFNAPSNICLNQPVTFQNASSSPPVSSSWNFGDGTTSAQINPIKTFLVPGTFTVTLVNQYASCSDSVSKTITVNDKPQVNFTVNDSTSCQAPFSVQFTDLTPGASSWLWDFGDGNTSTLQNPVHQYNSIGNYTVSLTVTTVAGCSNTLVKNAYIKIQPISISLNVPVGGCIPFTYTPLATIQTLDPIVSYQWDLGEPGAVFNVQNPPPYTYNNPGSYTITLTVTSASGCTRTVSAPGGVLTGTRPTVDFSFSPLNACASNVISFTNLSVTSPGAQVAWFWNFGDGAIANVQNPQHIFTDTGSITTTLVVFNNDCADSIKHILQVKPPVARFNYKFDCVTRLVTFKDSSLADPALVPLTYLWQMGDPANTQFSVQNPPPFTYPSPGTYNVTLTVTNGPCSYQVTQPVTIANEPADFSINRNPVCRNETFTLTALNSNPSNIASYTWIIGGVTLPGMGRSVSYSLPTTGTYDVTLTIKDLNGCITTRTIANYITVNGPVARFNPVTPGACLNKTITFTDLSTPAGTIANWHYDFGDGTQQNFSSPPFTHTYSQLGGYNVSLTVTDQQGCTDAYYLPSPLLVTNPAAGFKADTFYCPGAPLQFVDTSAGAGLTYLWNFGDGNTSTIRNPQHSYPLGDNSYTVKLTITDISGCKDSIIKPAYISIRSPKAAFGIRDTSTVCPPLQTSFTFLGSDYQSFFWSFGDGGISTLPNPTYFYSNYGAFIPTLYVIGPGGCIDSAKSSVSVHSPADAKVNEGPVTTGCNSLNVDFNLVVPSGFKFFFYFGDGTLDSSGRTSFSHFYSRPSLSNPELVIQDTISGCLLPIYGTPVKVLGAVPLFGMDKKEFCDNGPVVFTDFTTKNEPIISTVWDFGDGGTSGVQNPVHNFTQPGIYIVRLNITTQSNCSSSYSDTVLVYRTPVPSIFGKDTVCLNAIEPYNGMIAVPDSVTNWQWSFGNGQTSTQQNNNTSFTSPGNYTLQLITSNKLGCSDTAIKIIYASPPPTATPVQEPVTINVGSGANLLMNYTGNITSYSWTPGTRLSCNNCSVPFADPKSDITYTVKIQDRYGCINQKDITVVVLCNKANFFVPNTFSPNGDGQNEIFYPRGTGLFRIKSMLIFNRWGELVFEKKDFLPNDPSAGWTGIFKGQKASADVYVYMIDILCDNNTVIPVKGSITLLR